MATDNSAGAIFIDLGLDISQLESDFVAANATIQQNLNRLNRERNLIDLRAQVEIGGLDETADAAQILEIRERSLNQQLEIQRDRIQLTRAAFQQLRNTQGATAAATQNMEARLQREQLSLQRLEQQLNSVTTAQENLNSGTNSGGESAESAGLEFGGLDSILDKLPPHAKAAVAGFTALTGAIIAAGTASNDLIERWRELQKQSYNFNLPVNDMETLARRVKFTGGEIEDLHGFLAGLNDAMTKGEWDDPEAIAMRWAGGNIFDANGKLKRFDEQVEEIYRMYQKAKEAGQEIEFLQMMGGESGVTDVKQILDRWEEAQEDAEKIFDAGLDPEEFHKADRALRLLTEQTGEFKDAFENIVTPFSVGAFEKLFEVFHDGTEFLVENKDTIQRWGFVAIETFSTVADKIKAVKDAIADLADTGNEIPNFINDWEGNAQWQRFLDQANNDYENTFLQGVYKPAAKEMLGGIGNAIFGGILERAQEEQDKYNGKVEEGTKSWADFRREQEKGIEATKEETETIKDATDALSQYNYSREVALRDELEGVKLENQHFKHGHDLELAQLDLERELNLRQLAMSESEKLAVEELYTEKRKNIQLRLEDELDGLRDEATAEFKTDLENRMIEIENAKDDWIDAGMEEAEAEKYAQALKAKAIEDLEEEWAEAVLAINGSVLEQKLANIEKEKQAWIQKGVEEVKATQWAEQAKVDAQRNAAMEVLKNRLEEYRAFQEGGYQGLKDYQLKKLYDLGIAPEDLKITPEQLSGFQKSLQVALNSLLPNFMTEEDKYRDKRLSDYSLFEEQKRLREKHEDPLFGTKIIFDGEDVTEKALQEIFGLIPKEELTNLPQSFSEATESFKSLGSSTEDLQQKFEDLVATPTNLPEENSTPTSPANEPDLSGGLDSLSPKFENLSSYLDDLTPTIENVSSSFDNLTPTLENATSYFAELTEQVANTTGAFLELIGKIGKINFQQNSTPPNVTNNVNIQEAHAWDYSHIKELAERVADVITPKILSALGGGSNSY